LRKYVLHDILKLLKLTVVKERIVAELIMLTPGYQNEFIGCQTAYAGIAVQQMIGEMLYGNSKIELLKQVY
jgi:hypothetical protein